MIEQFKQFLKEKYQITDTIDNHINYNESLDEQTLEKLMKSSYEGNLIEAVRNYLWEYYPDFFDFDNQINYYIAEFEKHTKQTIDRENLRDWADAYFKYNDNIDQLIKQSSVSDPVIYFGDNWEDDYLVLDATLNHNELTLANTPIHWLIETQGYVFSDLYDEAKRKQSKFLTSLYDECYDYINNLDGCQLVCIPNTSDLTLLYACIKGQPITIKKGTTFGLFNRTYGSGSGLQIITEKDISTKDAPIHDITLATRDKSYDYSPKTVYNYVKNSNQEDLTSL